MKYVQGALIRGRGEGAYIKNILGGAYSMGWARLFKEIQTPILIRVHGYKANTLMFDKYFQ